jgi:hypothetical protein
MPKLSRTTVKPLPKLHWVKQKFEELPGVKFSLSLPGVVLNALEGHDDLEASLIGDIARTLGGTTEDHQTAARIRKLQKAGVGNGITSGTVPELVVYDYLERMGYEFLFQPAVDGGRGAAGGAVPDFAVNIGGKYTVFLVNGVYWHSRKEISASDEVDKLTILSSTINGLMVERVVELWDETIYKKRPQVFTWGLAGIELGY